MMALMARGNFRIRRIWLPGLFGRITALLFSLSLLTLYLYAVGGIQGFTDETLIVLFTVEAWLVVLCAAAGFFSALSYIVLIPLSRNIKVGSIILSALVSAVSLVLYLGIALLRAFMDGYV